MHTQAKMWDASGKKGMLSCSKCVMRIGANLAHIQPGNPQNVQKMCFWQRALGVNAPPPTFSPPRVEGPISSVAPR